VPELTVQLAADHHHPHLLPILTNLLRFHFPSDGASSFPDSNPAVVGRFRGWLWLTWWSSEGENLFDFINLMNVFRRLLQESILGDFASFLRMWFCNPETRLHFCRCHGRGAHVGPEIAQFPGALFNVLCFCSQLADVDNSWIDPVSEMDVVLVQSPRCFAVLEAFSWMDAIRGSVLPRGLSGDAHGSPCLECSFFLPASSRLELPMRYSWSEMQCNMIQAAPGP
jgi:hypothetical protein